MQSNSVADKCRDVFDRSCQIAYFPGTEPINFELLRSQNTQLSDFEVRFVFHEANLVAHSDFAVFDPEIDNDSSVAFEIAVKNQRAQRLADSILGRVDEVYDCFQRLFDADVILG